MTDDEIKQVVAALRAAAGRIERGDLSVAHGVLEVVSLDYDGAEHHDSFDEAQRHASIAIEPVDGEYHPEVGQVSWGVYVAVEVAEITVMPPDHDYGGGPASEYGYDAWWEVGLVNAWGKTR